MKLLTYNFLSSKCIRGVKTGYPLILYVKQKEVHSCDFDPEFISKILPRLNWQTVCMSAEKVGFNNDIPNELTQNFANDHDLLQKIHHLLIEIEIVDGFLECPETGRLFPITQGIPNMLLNENEV